MTTTTKRRSFIACSLCASLAFGLAGIALSDAQTPAPSLVPSMPAHDSGDIYQQHNLVSDGFVTADHVDPNLVNAWGLAFNPFGVVWVADNGTGDSTLYDGAGTPQSLVVQIPTPSADNGGNPTGIVFNGSSGFVVTAAGVSGVSKFIFVTEDGVIAGWAPNVDATHAILAVDNSTSTGAIYKGVALSAGGSGQLLYAADFHNAKVDVFDSSFASVDLASSSARNGANTPFHDPRVPSGFAPFGIQAISGNIYVTYAQQDAAKHDEVDGRGLGYVDVYDPNGALLHRVASRGSLNAPWGVALAPAGFGQFSNTILVGNFGDGTINAFEPVFNFPVGTLRGPDHKPIKIDGLWGLAFGNGLANQPVNSLFFAAGPAEEAHGLYGRLDPAAETDEDTGD